MREQWEVFEDYCQQEMHLDTTVASGAQWHDLGDGINREVYGDNPFRLMIDAKATIKAGYSVNRKFMKQWVAKATERGKRFVLPIRFHDPKGHEDYVVMTMDDFLELLEITRPTDG